MYGNEHQCSQLAKSQAAYCNSKVSWLSTAEQWPEFLQKGTKEVKFVKIKFFSNLFSLKEGNFFIPKLFYPH